MSLWFAYLAGIGTVFIVGFAAFVGFVIWDYRHEQRNKATRYRAGTTTSS